MSESSSEEAEPQTPPRYPRRQQQHGDASPTLSSPPASPSLSFHSLGRSPFSPLRHQVSAPIASSAGSAQPAEEDQTDVAEDSKDVLIQRLHSLMAKLSTRDEVRASSVDSMHVKMDELEQALQQDLGNKERRHQRNKSSLDMKDNDLDLSSTQARPSLKLKSLLSEMVLPASTTKPPRNVDELPEPPADSRAKTPDTDAKHATFILAQAKELQRALETVVNNLKARQEEQEHIHDLLITRAERAAMRIIHLEERVSHLENERNEGEMEVLNLQIQLKAIEVQCLSYVPRDVDPELLESINTWKTEWSALKKKRTHKKDTDSSEQHSPNPQMSRRQLLLRSQTAG